MNEDNLDLGVLPRGFLWGASTSAHQIEGNNVASDMWALEHRHRGLFAEPSLDACDSYHRWPEDLDLVRDAGLGAYRFSIEWARIEPEPGYISRAELDHYRRMITGCWERGLEPVVTLHHFTSPRWFTRRGGWLHAEAVDAFSRYVEALAGLLDGVRWIVTINEPNIVATFGRLTRTNGEADEHDHAPGQLIPDEAIGEVLIRAHQRAVDILKARSSARVGWSVATQAFRCRPGAETAFTQWNRWWEDLYLEPAAQDDFLGIQAYTSRFVGPEGPEPVPEGEPTSRTGWAYRPDALGLGLRRAWEVTGGTPLLVTENGVATDDDELRVWHTTEALRSMKAAMDAGVSVLGYLHWSLLDNFEWGSGYRPTFGLVAVDRQTFVRTPKASAAWLGDVARRSAAVPGGPL